MQSFYVFYYLYFPYQTRAIFAKIAQILMLMCRIWSYDYKKKDKKNTKIAETDITISYSAWS